MPRSLARFQGHPPGEDLSNLFAGDVANLCPRLDRETIEDVVVLIAFGLSDPANNDAVGGNNVPALLDLEPRDRVACASVIATR